MLFPSNKLNYFNFDVADFNVLIVIEMFAVQRNL